MRRAGKIAAWVTAVGLAGVGVVTTVALVAIVLLLGSLSFEGCDLDIGDVGPGRGPTRRSST